MFSSAMSLFVDKLVSIRGVVSRTRSFSGSRQRRGVGPGNFTPSRSDPDVNLSIRPVRAYDLMCERRRAGQGPKAAL